MNNNNTTKMTALCLVKTKLFSVLEVGTVGRFPAKDDVTKENDTAKEEAPVVKETSLPILNLTDLLLHKERNTTAQVHQQLMDALKTHGFIFLKVSKQSQPGKIINGMRQALHEQLFPNHTPNDLPTSNVVYLSEKSVPMWKLGYEKSEDGIREFFRIYSGCVDDQPWPRACSFRETWLRGLALCRHVCDQALDICIDDDDSVPSRRVRPSSGPKAWTSTKYSQTPIGELNDRKGDFSVMYGMHYFNETDLGRASGHDNAIIALKQHVDPSLCVLEPFLAANCPGLQVLDQATNQWIDCDGPSSPVASHVTDTEELMCLFVGRAFCKHCPEVQPTLHRVVSSNQSRRSIIYEQKYEEYFE
jgi:hypothetical protein